MTYDEDPPESVPEEGERSVFNDAPPASAVVVRTNTDPPHHEWRKRLRESDVGAVLARRAELILDEIAAYLEEETRRRPTWIAIARAVHENAAEFDGGGPSAG